MYEPTYTPPPADRSVKVPHLVFGLLFLGVAGIWVLGASDLISGESLAVLGPGVLIVAGVIGLAASLANGRSRRRSAPAQYAAESHEAPAAYSTTETTTDTPSDTTSDTTTDYVADDGNEHTEEIR